MGEIREHRRAAGLDLGKATIAATIRRVGRGGHVEIVESVWGTTSSQILALRDVLAAAGVSVVAMEATSDYWKPVYWLLEDLPDCELLLVNPAHLKILKGRKSDRTDAQFLAWRAASGELSGSFVPPAAARGLRDWTRRRTEVVVLRGAEAQRLEKTLEDTGMKISVFITDLTGASARRILTALIAGERDPQVLADLGDVRLKATRAQLVEACTGRFTEHHAALVADHLALIDHYQARITAIEARIAAHIDAGGHHDDIARLDTIPGIGVEAAQVIVSEAGFDMAAFPTAAHFASWLGLAGGTNESAGIKRKAAPAKGNRAIRRVLGQAALSVMSHQGTYLHARYQRLRRRMDARKAQVAIMHDMAIAIWHILAEKVPYRELGPDYFTRKDPDRVKRQISRLAASIGMTAELTTD